MSGPNWETMPTPFWPQANISRDIFWLDQGVDAQKQAYLEVRFKDHSDYLRGQKFDFVWGGPHLRALPQKTTSAKEDHRLRLDHVLSDVDDARLLCSFSTKHGKACHSGTAWRLVELVPGGNGGLVSSKGDSVIALVKYKEDANGWPLRGDLPGLVDVCRGVSFQSEWLTAGVSAAMSSKSDKRSISRVIGL